MANVFIDDGILRGWADTVREKTGATDQMIPAILLQKTKDNWGTGGGSGGDSELVRYVTFLDEDGSELFKMPVLVGDDCKDPVSHGDISTPTKESTNTQVFTHSGWTSTVGGTADSDILKNITEDKTVYAAFTASVRYYTVRFYDGETLLNTMQVEYGADVSGYAAEKDGYVAEWNPSPNNVTSDMDCYAVWIDISGFASAPWSAVISACQNNDVPDTWAVGDKKTMKINDVDYVFMIVGKNHDTYADGGTAPLTFAMEDCYNQPYKMSIYGSSSGGFKTSDMYKTYLPEIKALMPTEVQEAIRPVVKKCGGGYSSPAAADVNCELFLFSESEITGKVYGYSTEGSIYEYWNENLADRTKKIKYVGGVAQNWWLRTPANPKTSSLYYCFYTSAGSENYNNADKDFYVSFCFCF